MSKSANLLLLLLLLVIFLPPVAAIGENLTATVILAHMNGTAGINTFTDEVGHILARNNTYIDNNVKKLGNAAGSFQSANSSYLYSPPSADFNLGRNWEIDTWFNNTMAASTSYYIFNFGESTSNLAFILTGRSTSSGYGRVSKGGSAIGTNINSIAAGVWNHLAIQQNGTYIDIFINGTLVQEISNSADTDAS